MGGQGRGHGWKHQQTYQIVREQSRRISRCRLTFFRREGKAELVTNGAFVRDAILPADPDAVQQLPLWQDRVRLDEGFFQSLIEHPLPLREAAIREISNRSMTIDLYVWLAYRLHALSKPTPLSWTAIAEQFGAGFQRQRDLKPRFIEALKLALAVYPQARVELDDRTGMFLYPSPPAVPKMEARRLGLS